MAVVLVLGTGRVGLLHVRHPVQPSSRQVFDSMRWVCYWKYRLLSVL